jgi:Mg2+-importing ATPase
MQGSLTSQDTPVPPRESQAETHTLPLKSLLEQLQSSEQGLTSEEALKRQDTYGPNEAVGTKRNSGLIQFLRQFLNPLIAILLLAAIVAAILGDIANASIVIVIVLLSNVLTFVQTYQSQNAVEKLRAGVAPTAAALRDGKWVEIPRRDLVPGDMIRLVAGDLVSADARLVQATDLHVQQAALTGESLPVEKSADDLNAPSESFAEAHNYVFLGTSVVSGTATAWLPRQVTIRLLAKSPHVWPVARHRPSLIEVLRVSAC